MANISFALTTQEFLDGRKTATRRFWKDIHLDRWQKWYDDGKRLHTAVGIWERVLAVELEPQAG